MATADLDQDDYVVRDDVSSSRPTTKGVNDRSPEQRSVVLDLYRVSNRVPIDAAIVDPEQGRLELELGPTTEPATVGTERLGQGAGGVTGTGTVAVSLATLGTPGVRIGIADVAIDGTVA